MKKIVLILAILLAFVQTSYAYQIQGSTQTKKLPIGTKLPLKMMDSITTKDVEVGDMFSASLVEDVILDKSIVLPKGTLVRGNISRINEAKRLSKCANLYLTFDHIVTPQGRQLPIRAGLSSNFKLTLDGGITTGGNYGDALAKNWDNTVDIVKKSTNWGAKRDNASKYVLAPLGAIGGVTGGSLYLIGDSIADLFRKGEPVVINQGQVFGIMLLSPLDVPANY